MKIIVDSREQKPLWTKGVVVKKLDVGDYSIEGFESEIAIERKGLVDLFGTLGKGHARFKKEIERAQSLKYFAIVVEGSHYCISNKEFEGSHHTRMSGSVVIKILFTLHMKCGLSFFLCANRDEAKSVIELLLNTYIKLKVKDDEKS